MSEHTPGPWKWKREKPSHPGWTPNYRISIDQGHASRTVLVMNGVMVVE